jgi:hypothetical protein
VAEPFDREISRLGLLITKSKKSITVVDPQSRIGDTLGAMNVADEILRAAEKLLQAKDRLKQASEEYEIADVEYRRTVERATVMHNGAANGNGTAHLIPIPSRAVTASKLRDRIEQFLMESPGVPMGLDEIERGVGAEADHKRLVWTLSNMTRDRVIKHEGRGLWSIAPPEEPRDDADINF